MREIILGMGSLIPLTFDQIARTLADELHRMQHHPVKLLGITGPSCVGKTTLCERIAAAIRVDGHTALAVSADSFLKHEYRGRREFRQDVNEHLTPCHFDYQGLVSTVKALVARQSCQMDGYVRGSGWLSNQIMHAADVLLIDGLFLDGLETQEGTMFDLRIILEASERSIAVWRRLRDHQLRRSKGGGFRGAEDTEREIERTLLAYRSYARFEHPEDVFLLLDDDHRIIALEGHSTVRSE